MEQEIIEWFRVGEGFLADSMRILFMDQGGNIYDGLWEEDHGFTDAHCTRIDNVVAWAYFPKCPRMFQAEVITNDLWVTNLIRSGKLKLTEKDFQK